MPRASGRFFQYFFGISEVIAWTLTRAGIEDVAEVGAPEVLVAHRREARGAADPRAGVRVASLEPGGDRPASRSASPCRRSGARRTARSAPSCGASARTRRRSGGGARRGSRPMSRKRTKAVILCRQRITAFSIRQQARDRRVGAILHQAAAGRAAARAGRRAGRSVRGRCARPPWRQARRSLRHLGPPAPSAAAAGRGEERRRRGAVVPQHLLGRHARGEQTAGGVAPGRRRCRSGAGTTDCIRTATAAPARGRSGRAGRRRRGCAGRQSSAVDEGPRPCRLAPMRAQVVPAQGAVAARREDPADRLGAEAGHAQQALAAGAVDVDREGVRGWRAPRRALGRGRDRGCRRAAAAVISSTPEAVEAQEPVGLVEAMLAHERRLDQRQLGGGIGDRREGGIVDPLQPVVAVEPRRLAEDRAVGRAVGADDHLGRLPGGREPCRALAAVAALARGLAQGAGPSHRGRGSSRGPFRGRAP